MLALSLRLSPMIERQALKRLPVRPAVLCPILGRLDHTRPPRLPPRVPPPAHSRGA